MSAPRTPAPLVLSIQSQVVHGHVGNSAAVFPMQAAGLTVAAVPTTLLSNNPHYPTMRGQVLDAALVEDLLLGLTERGLIEKARFLVTGYLGSAEIGAVVARFVRLAKARNPDLVYICDPVMGDIDLGVYVKPDIPELMRGELVPLADLLTPNQFELGLLTDHPTSTAKELSGAFQALCDARPSGAKAPTGVIATGCVLADTPQNHLDTVLVQASGLHRCPVPRLPVRPAGTGDLFTALMIGRLAAGTPLPAAVAHAVGAMQEVLARTAEAGAEEMVLNGFAAAG